VDDKTKVFELNDSKNYSNSFCSVSSLNEILILYCLFQVYEIFAIFKRYV
jgi:hypothetical protein